MKMTKLISFVMVLAVCLSLMACGQKDGGAASVEGKYKPAVVVADGHYFDPAELIGESIANVSMTFNKGGTGESADGEATEPFKWTLDGNKITIEINDEKMEGIVDGSIIKIDGGADEMPMWLLKDGASLPADIKFTSFQEYLEDQMAAATATGTEAAE